MNYADACKKAKNLKKGGYSNQMIAASLFTAGWRPKRRGKESTKPMSPVSINKYLYENAEVAERKSKQNEVVDRVERQINGATYIDEEIDAIDANDDIKSPIAVVPDIEESEIEESREVEEVDQDEGVEEVHWADNAVLAIEMIASLENMSDGMKLTCIIAICSG